MNDESKNPLHVFIEEYHSYLTSSFDHLWAKIEVEPDKLEAYSAIGGLLSRQVTLSMQLSGSPRVWNGHSAPLFLRAMTDLQITLSWMLQDIEERSKKYILHGLGEVKLLMEHYKAEREEHPENDEDGSLSKMAEVLGSWVNSQRREFFVEVNLGHWAQLDYRTMAQESGNEGLYKFAYKPFSQTAHNMWPHVSIYNCKRCENPLHRYHLVPELFDPEADVDYVYRSCKYVDKTYRALIDRFGIELDLPMPLEWWSDFFSREDGSAESTAEHPSNAASGRQRNAKTPPR